MNITNIVAVLDRSGSMKSLEGKTLEGFNGFVTEQKQVSGGASLSLYLFDDKFETVHDFIDIQDVPELTKDVYYARGMTALHDSIGKAIVATNKKIASLPES